MIQDWLNWVPGSLLSNPAGGAVLVDTGPLEGGRYLLAVLGAGSVAWTYDLQHRTAANTANVASQRRRPAAGNDEVLFPNKLLLSANERLRCELVGAIVGEVQMSIFYYRVGLP